LSIASSEARSAMIGRSQRRPSGERLTMNDIPASEIPSVTASQVPCAASQATTGSVATVLVPGGVENIVTPGRKPERHVPPVSVDVAQPIPAAPPAAWRPD
jgi:hypothetical protein